MSLPFLSAFLALGPPMATVPRKRPAPIRRVVIGLDLTGLDPVTHLLRKALLVKKVVVVNVTVCNRVGKAARARIGRDAGPTCDFAGWPASKTLVSR
jgi:hypothetical protein